MTSTTQVIALNPIKAQRDEETAKKGTKQLSEVIMPTSGKSVSYGFNPYFLTIRQISDSPF
jgi:hypothetical protein